MRIAQSGERLVEGVPWRPEAVEIERGGADVTLRQRRECLAAALECAEITIACLS
jgi:hypothetical protein